MAIHPHRGGGRAGRAAALVLASALVMMAAAPAGAAGVGPIYSYTQAVWAESGTRHVCLEAYVTKTPGSWSTTNNSTVSANYGTATVHCTNVDQVSTGTLAAVAKGYRNGVYCGSTGNIYNPAPTGYWFAQGNLCSIFTGTYTYKTTAEALVRNTAGAYLYHGPLNIELNITK